MTQGDTVEVTLVSGQGWCGTVSSYTDGALVLRGHLYTWAVGMRAVSVEELDEEFREVVIPWRRIDFIEVWK